MPRLEVIEINDQGYMDFFSDEPSATIDVCAQCDENTAGSEWMEDDDDEVRQLVKNATGQDSPPNFMLGGGCEHPSYDEMDYTCAFCGKQLQEREDG